MKRKRHNTDEVIRKLRQAEALGAQGKSVGQVCQKLEVSEATVNCWRKEFREMGDDDIKPLRALGEERRAGRG